MASPTGMGVEGGAGTRSNLPRPDGRQSPPPYKGEGQGGGSPFIFPLNECPVPLITAPPTQTAPRLASLRQ
jgi:hypothetical protein